MATNKASSRCYTATEIRERIRSLRRQLHELELEEGSVGSVGGQGSVGSVGGQGSVGGHRGSVGAQRGSVGCPVDFEEEEEEEWRLEAEAEPTAPFDEATIKFPNGISSMRQWGKVLFQYGTTYQNKSYEEMAASTDKMIVSYLKRIQTRDGENPFVIDFMNYLQYYDLLHPKPEVLTFPGSNTVRRFAPDTEKGE